MKVVTWPEKTLLEIFIRSHQSNNDRKLINKGRNPTNFVCRSFKARKNGNGEGKESSNIISSIISIKLMEKKIMCKNKRKKKRCQMKSNARRHFFNPSVISYLKIVVTKAYRGFMVGKRVSSIVGLFLSRFATL